MLLDEIIGLLSDQNGSLEGALLKTKVLLRIIGHKELVPWVSNELTGYSDVKDLPPYRIVSSQARGHVVWGYREDRDWVLPIHDLTDQQLEIVSNTKMTSSIGTIEQQVKTYREQRQGLVVNLPPEFSSAFQKSLTPGTNIISLWCAVNMADVEGIVIQVRSRLLDFALDLQEVVGVNAAPQELITKAPTVDTGSMFRMAIYNTGGTVIVGSHNFQVNNQKEDIEGLLKEVAKLGYDQKELDELRKAVIEDKNKNETPTVTDGETGKWYVNALKKVGKGAVKVGVDVATSPLF
jgi:hypothetical protein